MSPSAPATHSFSRRPSLSAPEALSHAFPTQPPSPTPFLPRPPSPDPQPPPASRHHVPPTPPIPSPTTSAGHHRGEKPRLPHLPPPAPVPNDRYVLVTSFRSQLPRVWTNRRTASTHRAPPRPTRPRRLSAIPVHDLPTARSVNLPDNAAVVLPQTAVVQAGAPPPFRRTLRLQPLPRARRGRPSPRPFLLQRLQDAARRA